MVARTRISDGYRALVRSWRPSEALPGARFWADAQAGGLEALVGWRGIWRSSRPGDR